MAASASSRRSRLAGDGFDLPDGPVLVLLALDDQDRAGDGGEEILDRPGGEFGPQADPIGFQAAAGGGPGGLGEVR